MKFSFATERVGGACGEALARPAAHIVVLIIGAAFLLTDAFHGNIWFDESYSVAIAAHSFGDIWYIGSGDVHPVLFYWALHILYLVFGQNVLVYRLFTVAGAVALATLGFTHVRRDFGWKVGLLFSFFALFTPYISIMAVEVRMYSWATFTVTACFIYAWRIIREIHGGGRVRCHWWALFFLASLASAYLHYFGVLSAFMVNVILLGYLAGHAVRARRPRADRDRDRRVARVSLAAFAVSAVAQVALYLPWLAVLASQMGVVSQTYWANIVFPTTFIELATYPIMTSPISFAVRGNYGLGWEIALYALWGIAVVLVAVLAVAAARGATARSRQGEDSAAGGAAKRFATTWRFRSWPMDVRAMAAALGVYLGVYAIALAASVAMNSLILYYRYLFIAIGPLLLAMAIALSHVRSNVVLGGLCAVLFSVSVINQALLVSDDYDGRNDEPLAYLDEKVESLKEETGIENPLVTSTDIGFMGPVMVRYPQIQQVYMDWQKGNWDRAYLCYAPSITSQKSWESIFDGFTGKFILLGQSQTEATPRDISDLSNKQGFVLLSTKTFYRPYERTWFTVAVMEKY